MDGIIDSLIGFLPVIFAVLWILRLVSRRKKKQAVSAQQPESELKLVQEPVQAAPRPMPGPKPKAKPVQTAVQSRRLVKDFVSPDAAAGTSENKVSDVEFIKELSPLAQGIVWSVILDKPLSLKEPEM